MGLPFKGLVKYLTILSLLWGNMIDIKLLNKSEGMIFSRTRWTSIKMIILVVIWDQCYKTFYVHCLRMLVISWSVCA